MLINLLLVTAFSGHLTASQADIIIENGNKLFVLKGVTVQTGDVEIHSDSGYYDEARNRAVLWGNLILKGNTYTIKADTMIYVEKPETLIFSSNAFLEDTVFALKAQKVVDLKDTAFAYGGLFLVNKPRKVTFWGDSGIYIPAVRKGLIFGNARARFGEDTSEITVSAKIIVFQRDTFFAYGDVHTVSKNVESLSDSAYFVQNDSTAFLWDTVSINWSQGHAVSDTSVISFRGGRLHSMHLIGDASFTASDSTGSVTLNGDTILITVMDSSSFSIEGRGKCSGKYISAEKKEEQESK